MPRTRLEAHLSRRLFLRGLTLVGASTLLAACAPSAPASKPAETKPAETKPAAPAAPAATTAPAAPAKPAESKPAEAAKPAESKPAAAPAATTAPAAATSGGGKDAIVVAHAGLSAGEQTLDPNFESTEASVHLNLFNTLVAPVRSEGPNPQFSFVPALAESWAPSADRLSWEMKLRKGVKFHNGDEMTAEDVKFTFDQMTNPDFKSRLAAAGFFEGVKGFSVVDPYTVRVETTEPLPSIETKLTRMYIYPSKYYKQVGAEEFGQKPVGTGSYKFVSWKKGDEVQLEAHKVFWGGAPAINKVTLKQVPEASTRAAMLRSGQADLINDVPPQLYETIKADAKFDTFILTSMQHLVLGLNGQEGPTADIRVRQAMNYAVNKEEIVERLFRGFARRCVSFAAEGLPGYTQQINAMYPYDLEKAKALMAEAGYANGFETSLLYSDGRVYLGKEWTQAIVGYLEKIGIKATIETAEGAQRLERIRKNQVPNIFLTSLLNQDMDAAAIYRIWLAKSGRGFYWPNLNVEAELAAQRGELDPNKRRAILEEINKKTVEHASFIFSHMENSGWGSTKGLKITPRHDGFIVLDKARF